MAANHDQEGRHDMLALSWHGPQEVITSGGMRRTIEILARTPDGVSIVCLDNSPSFFRVLAGPRLQAHEYRVPARIRALEPRFFLLERVLEWTLSTVIMIWKCLAMRARGQGFDTVFIPSSEQLPALIAGIAAKRIFGSDLVVCNTNMDIFPRSLRKALVWLHDRADVVIVISRHLAARFLGYGAQSMIVVNGVGLDADRFAEIEQPAAKDVDAIFIGRHDSEKGVFDLVRIWEAVVRELPEARLVTVGSCNPRIRKKLTSLISTLGLVSSITLAGTLDDSRKVSLLKRSRICLFPSHVEEWGIVPQEALAAGLPVVCYDLPVFEENIKRCEAVFTLSMGDIEGMARRVTGLLAGGDFERYALVGPDFVRRFGWDAVAEREFLILTGDRTGLSAAASISDPGDEPDAAGDEASSPVSATYSVVIPAFNEAANIGDLLDDIARQQPEGYSMEKVVVVSDGSTDATEAIVASRAAVEERIELRSNPRRLGNAQAINIGKKDVRSDYLVILDGDIRLEDEDVLYKLLAGIGPDVGMVSGNPRPVPGSGTFAESINRCGAFIRDELRCRVRGGNNLISALGCILALDRRLYQEVEIPLNPHSPELLVPNDQFFYMKCLEKGMRFETRAEARVRYRLSSSLGDTVRQGVRFVFSMYSMDSFFEEALLAREYSFPMRAIILSLASSFMRMPLLTIAWGALHSYIRLKVFAWRHFLGKGVAAAWDVSRSSKSSIDWNIHD